jgi:hypothetical protein
VVIKDEKYADFKSIAWFKNELPSTSKAVAKVEDFLTCPT